MLVACLACASTSLAQGDPCPDPCNPACPDYNECDCIGDPCDPACGGDPCDPACGGDPCDPSCGGDPCDPSCGGDPCDPGCGGDPCDPSCPSYDPCYCENDPCDPSCPDYEPCLYPECPDYDECYCFGGPLSCNPLCDEYDPYCSGECPEYDPCQCPGADPCDCGFGDPCECGTDPCDPACGGTPECDPDCGGDPCDPFCGGDPCDPDGDCYDPCNTDCPDYDVCNCDPASCAAPANDECDAYLALTDGVTVFDTTLATSGPPFNDFTECDNFGNLSVYNDIWYKYQATCTGSLLLTTCGGTYWDTRIVVYDGPCNDGGVLLACNDDGDDSSCTNYTSRLQIDVIAGTAYFVRLGGYTDGGGDVGRLFVECTPAPNECDEPLPECPTDLDESGTTDVTDLLAVLAAWNQTGPPRPEGDCAPEGTGDCIVDVLDLLAVLNAWGLCSGSCDDPCNIDCDNYDPCEPACGGDPCDPACGGDPCDPICGGDPCDPDCGGDPCDPACGGDPCDPACGGGDPCDPACGGDPCYPECGGDPCDPDCGGDPCDPACGGDPCDPSCTPDPCSDPSSECYDECECTYCLYPDCPDYDECYCYGGPLECNPLCPDYNPYCNPACAEYDPCNPWADCYDPCECGDPCDPECGGGDPCDPDCGGDPCDPACGGDPCDPACGGDPCDPACGGDCGDDEGACCAFDTCNQLTQKTCALLGGTFYGAGTFCADITCVTCDANELIDCNGNCFPANWVNDGYCDDGTYVYEGNPIDLTCATYNCDGGDCPAESCP